MSVEVATPVYSGPFDLLLQLILREQVDIHELCVSHIVEQFLAEVERLQALDLDVATEFLLIAATLVELKARRLLPGVEAEVDLDEELALWEERDLLLARLLEAKTFKDVAVVLARLGETAALSVPRTAGPDERFAGLVPDLLTGVTPQRLRQALIRALTPRPVPTVDLTHVAPIRASVADAVADLAAELPHSGPITFRRLTADLVDRIEVIVQFLAVLELFKQGLVEVEQAERFGEIRIRWVGEGSVPATVDEYEG